MPPLRLRPLRIEDETEALAAHSELEPDGFPFLLGWEPQEPWARYVSRLGCRRRGIELPERWVASTFLAAEAEERLVGRISIRHELNRYLADFGGHIGYGVRPAFRRRGYATEILRQGLILARAEGVEAVLVTCDEGNRGSIAVIERLGGVLEDVRVDEDGVPRRRYWIA
ncbi:MAG: GNAT family N-acetyltransferase [Solirubrobacteraceae bacterium]